MDDAAGNESSRLSTPGGRGLELDDGDGLARLRSEQCEMLFDDEEMKALMKAGEGYILNVSFKDGIGKITVTTGNGSAVEMDDERDTITLRNAGGEDGEDDGGDGGERNALVLDGGEKSITLDSVDSTVVINGGDDNVTMESGDCRIAVDGGRGKIFVGDDGNNLTIDGGDGSITINAQSKIILRAGGKIIIDAKGGVVNKSGIVDFDSGSGGTHGGGSGDGGGDGGRGGSWASEASGAKSQGKTEKTQEATSQEGTDSGDQGMTEAEEGDGVKEETEPKITKISWVYGENHHDVSNDKSRHYVDLDLHVETENYNDGDTVDITLKLDNEQQSLFGTAKELVLSGTVYNNKAVFERVFKEYTLNI
jgi:hypothetical protein